MNLVLVTWRDAVFRLEDEDDPDDYLVELVGWELARNAHFLKIGSEKLPDDDGYRGITWIPLECVVSVVPLAGQAELVDRLPAVFRSNGEVASGGAHLGMSQELRDDRDRD